jgi:hypothetical protein
MLQSSWLLVVIANTFVCHHPKDPRTSYGTFTAPPGKCNNRRGIGVGVHKALSISLSMNVVQKR